MSVEAYKRKLYLCTYNNCTVDIKELFWSDSEKETISGILNRLVYFEDFRSYMEATSSEEAKEKYFYLIKENLKSRIEQTKKHLKDYKIFLKMIEGETNERND